MSSIITLLNSMAKRRQDERELTYTVGGDDTAELLAIEPSIYEDWPSRLGMVNSQSNDIAISLSNNWEPRTRYHGATTFPYHIRGFVRDSNGDPVSNAIVQLYRTSDDVFLREARSKDGGQYDLGVTDNTTPYYLVSYRAGPDIEGTTVNSLTGA